MSWGLSVALDGSTAVIGAPAAGTQPAQPGEAFVYHVTADGSLQPVDDLQAPNPQNGDLFGRSAAVSDGVIVIGAAAGSWQDPGNGSAYVFSPSGSGYGAGQSLLSTRPPGFGYAVAIDGPEILVGANTRDPGGAAYVFHSDGAGGWPLQQLLTPTPSETNGRFGNAVALDGSNLLIGADTVGNGAAYVFGQP